MSGAGDKKCATDTDCTGDAKPKDDDPGCDANSKICCCEGGDASNDCFKDKMCPAIGLGAADCESARRKKREISFEGTCDCMPGLVYMGGDDPCRLTYGKCKIWMENIFQKGHWTFFLE